MSTAPYKDLAKRLVALERRVAGASAPQLAHSSLEGGSINSYDAAGQLGAVLGTQADGTQGVVTVSGPIPPTPTGIYAESLIGALRIGWGGEFEPIVDPDPSKAPTPTVAPLDWLRAEVLVAPSPDQLALQIPRSTIESPRGGEAVPAVSYDTDYYIAVRSRTTAGKVSAMSQIIGPIRALRTTVEDLEIDFESLRGTQIFYGPDTPETTKADLWLKTPDNVAYRFNIDTGEWDEVRDQGITKALQDAAEANQAAEQAGIDALAAGGVAQAAQQAADDAAALAGTASSEVAAAQRAADDAAGVAQQAAQQAADAAGVAQTAQQAAQTAQGVADTAQGAAEQAASDALAAAGLANSKGRVYYQATAPSPGDPNGLWIDTDDGNRAYRWVVDSWSVVDNARIQQAANAAGTAQAAADTAKGAADSAAQQAEEAAQQASAAANAAALAAQAAADAQADATQALDDAEAARSLAQNAKTTADGKITVYRQSAAPTGGSYKPQGDLWIDSDDGKLYVATTTDGGWTETTDNRLAAALSTAQGAASTAATKNTVFAQTSQPSTTGRTLGDIWIDTDDSNRWYDWTGAWTARQWGFGAISATARQLGAITTYRQASAPTSGMIVGDFWIDSDDNVIYRYQDSTAGWVKSQDVNINTAIANAATAQATADGKMRIFAQASPPTGLGPGDIGDMWIDTDDSNVTLTWGLVGDTTYGWLRRQIGNGAIVPESLVASDVIATGTISAALLEAVMVLTTTIIAGDQLGTHSRLTPTGIYLYREDPVDGIPDQVGRLATDSDDFLSIVDSNGQLTASLDDTGAFNGRTANFREDILVRGRTIGDIALAGQTGSYYGYAREGVIQNVTTEIGLVMMQIDVKADHMYWIGPEVSFSRSEAGTQLNLMIRREIGNVNPTINSQTIWGRGFSNTVPGYDGVASSMGLWRPTVSGPHRLLLSASRAGSGTVTISDIHTIPTIYCIDLGPAKPIVASVNRGGGTTGGGGTPAPPPPPPTQQYDTGELFPAGYETFRGNGTQRTDVDAVVQGWDPSGYNGNGKGYWWWNLPNITGTVDRVDLYLYFESWYYNSGGVAVINMTDWRGNGGSGFAKLRTDWQVPGFPKPGGRWLTLPGDWIGAFKGSGYPLGRASAITLGPGDGTNTQFYGRSPSGTPRLRIWYTQ